MNLLGLPDTKILRVCYVLLTTLMLAVAQVSAKVSLTLSPANTAGLDGGSKPALTFGRQRDRQPLSALSTLHVAGLHAGAGGDLSPS